MLFVGELEEGNNIEGTPRARDNFSYPFLNRRGLDAASCCHTQCNRHNRDCNDP